MKKFFKFILAVVCAAAIGFMGYSLYETHTALQETTEKLEQLSYTEGKVDEGTNGDGVVTVSGDWLVFKDDTIIRAPLTNRSDYKISSDEIYSDLVSKGAIISSDGNLIKMKFSHQINTTITERIVFYVEGYYVTALIEG